jgi:hypothetical protein
MWLVGVPFVLFSVCCAGVVTVGVMGSAADQKALKEADDNYAAGKDADAVAVYKNKFYAASNKPEVLKRIVEYEAKKGDSDELRKWVKKGIDDKIDAAYDSPVAQQALAALKKEKEDREAREQADREAQAKKKKEEEAARAAEAARKAEEEYDCNGLVLLKKTVEGKHDEFSITITGTVVNRSPHKLAYAQITFNVYDGSGAQVGTALANINGLEPGGRWNFTAVALESNGTTYKFSELSGF